MEFNTIAYFSTALISTDQGKPVLPGFKQIVHAADKGLIRQIAGITDSHRDPPGFYHRVLLLVVAADYRMDNNSSGIRIVVLRIRETRPGKRIVHFNITHVPVILEGGDIDIRVECLTLLSCRSHNCKHENNEEIANVHNAFLECSATKIST